MRRTISAKCGQPASISRSSARVKAITSVGSAATQAEIVGSPVKTAMSPRKVPAVGLRDHDLLLGPVIHEVHEAVLDHVEGRVALPLLVERLAFGKGAALAGLGQPLDLLVAETREHDLVAEVRERYGGGHPSDPNERSATTRHG